MAKHLEKFIAPYRESQLPFLLGEPLTDGHGSMVDLVLRYANPPACSVLHIDAAALNGKRFSRLFPAAQLAQLSPLQTVAFSGSTAAFPYVTALGQSIQVICYQPMYGMVSCILDTSSPLETADPNALLTERLPGAAAILEVSRAGVRFVSFSRQLCVLTGREHRELSDFYADDLSALVYPEDWGKLLQALLDAVRNRSSVDHTFRVLRKDDSTLRVNLRADFLGREAGVSTFSALLLDVERQCQAQERQDAALSHTEDSLSLYTNLFHSLPGGYCILRQEDETMTPLFISQGLASLLGYPARELQRRLSEELLWRIPASDREALLTEIGRCRKRALPFRQICRLRVKDDSILWVLVQVVRQQQSDGSTLFLTACTDVTGEKEALSTLEFRAKLCDLLLDDPRVISFDYIPAEDICHIYRRDREGRRVNRTIPEYLHDLEHSAVIHPANQKYLASAFKRASTHPTTDVVEYQADYDGLGWRWYRVSWISLFDDKGNVYRLVGKAEDITRRRAAEQRFRELKKRLKKADKSVLTAVQLDLAANRILDARCPSRYLTQALFGNTADDFFSNMLDQIPEACQKEDFSTLFSREILLSSFHQGHLHLYREHCFTPGNGSAVWVETSAELIEDPETRHITAFCTVRDVDALHRQSLLLHTLAARDYDLVLAVNAASGHCRSYGRGPEEESYRTFSSRYQSLVGEKPPALDTVRQQLSASPVWTQSLPAPHPGAFSWIWLDEADEILLLTIQNSGLSFEKPQLTKPTS